MVTLYIDKLNNYVKLTQNIYLFQQMIPTNRCNDLIKHMTNRVFELIIQEMNKDDMKEAIKVKIIHPLLSMIYKQLYPYIYTLIIVIFLMFIMLIFLIVSFLIYLRK
jgi:hypothetical protein